MKTQHKYLMFAGLLASATVASAQVKQVVTPPETVYWLSAATQSGFAMPVPGAAPDMGAMMRMAMGGGGAIRLLNLDLGSKLPARGAPEASHAIPPGMAMGAALPLRTPQPSRPGTRTEPRDAPDQDFEPPKGRVLLFWGCGETARPGQPVVIDFARMAAGQIPPGLFQGEHVRIARPPGRGSWPSHGHWPNDLAGVPQSVPAKASLIGAHTVSGSYTPDINFTLQQDWMAPVALKQSQAASGAVTLSWNSDPRATAHFAQMMGAQEGEDESPTIVFWSSSEYQSFFSGLSDYVAPAEAARLVGRKQLLPPSQTQCAIPKEAVAAAQSGMISFVSHGPEVNIVHPPRPEDPKIPWDQEWLVKARYVSRAGAIIGMEDMAGMAGSPRDASADSRADNRPECRAQPDVPVGGMAGALARRMLGKGKPPPDCR